MRTMERKSSSFVMIFLFLFSIVSTSGCLEDEVSNSSNNDESNNDFDNGLHYESNNSRKQAVEREVGYIEYQLIRQ